MGLGGESGGQALGVLAPPSLKEGASLFPGGSRTDTGLLFRTRTRRSRSYSRTSCVTLGKSLALSFLNVLEHKIETEKTRFQYVELLSGR